MKKKIVGIFVCTLLIATALPAVGIMENSKIKIENNRNSAIVQPPEQWSKTFGGTEYEYGNSVQQTTDEGYIVTGITESYGAGLGDVWLIKTDSSGDEEWSKTFGGSYKDEGWYVIQTSDGGYIITGTTESYGAGLGDIWLIKTDSNGDEEWSKTFGGIDEEVGRSVQQTTDEGYIVTGYSESYGSGLTDLWIIKTDSSGDEEWSKTFGGIDQERGFSVQQTTDEGYIVTGSTWSYGAGDNDVWLIKTDSSGNEQWNKTFGGVYEEEAYSVELTSDGGYFIAATTKSFGAGNWDYYIIKTDADGNELWAKAYGGGAGDASRYGQQTSDGGYIVTGWTCSYGAGYYDTWLIKLNSEGGLIWSETYGGWDADSSMCVRQTNDGGYIISGGTESYGTYSYDVWLIKVGHINQPPSVEIINPKDGYFHFSGIPLFPAYFIAIFDAMSIGGFRLKPVIINATDDAENSEDLTVKVYLNGEWQGTAGYCCDLRKHEWFWTGWTFGIYNLTITAEDSFGAIGSDDIWISSFCLFP